jgi:putative transposase
MAHDADKHHRSSSRLKSFDYSSQSAYFITVCANIRTNVFGEIVTGEMHLNDAGEMIQRKWLEMPASFPILILNEFIVMPDHVHMIVGLDASEGEHRVRPYGGENVGRGDHRVEHVKYHDDRPADATIPRDTNIHRHPTGTKPDSLGRIVQLFKTVTTQAYIRGIHEQSWPAFEKRLWQRNYWDRVIRDDRELEENRSYILENPMHSFERLAS